MRKKHVLVLDLWAFGCKCNNQNISIKMKLFRPITCHPKRFFFYFLFFLYIVPLAPLLCPWIDRIYKVWRNILLSLLTHITKTLYIYIENTSTENRSYLTRITLNSSTNLRKTISNDIDPLCSKQVNNVTPQPPGCGYKEYKSNIHSFNWKTVNMNVTLSYRIR